MGERKVNLSANLVHGASLDDAVSCDADDLSCRAGGHSCVKRQEIKGLIILQEKHLHFQEMRGKLNIKGGLIVCPVCRQKTNQSVRKDTQAKNLPLWCRTCKTLHYVNIVDGQCYLISQSPQPP